jgi:hypothetical protein
MWVQNKKAINLNWFETSKGVMILDQENGNSILMDSKLTWEMIKLIRCDIDQTVVIDIALLIIYKVVNNIKILRE